MKPLPSEDLDHILRSTLPLWENTRGRRMFISGGTGFFGIWLLESLVRCNRELSLGIQATVLSRNAVAFAGRMSHLIEDGTISLLEGDVRSFPFPLGKFEYVIHGATSTSLDAAKRPLELMETLVHGTERMLGFAKACGAQSFLYLSSGAVYGRQPESLSHIPETYLGGPAWLEPHAVYGEGKRLAEQMCSVTAKEFGMRLAIARCFAFVGPHLPLDQHFAIGNFIGDVLAGRNINIQGDGTPMRSYLYAADLAVWLWTLLLSTPREAENPVTVNVGSGTAISIRDLAQEVVSELDPTLRIVVARVAEEGARREKYVPEVKRAEAQFGLRQLIDLREAIRRTGDWYR